MRRPSLLTVVGVLIVLVAVALAGLYIFRPKTNDSYNYTKAIAKTAAIGNLRTTMIGCRTDKKGKPVKRGCNINQYWTEQTPAGYWQLSFAEIPGKNGKKAWSLKDGDKTFVWSKQKKCLKEVSRKSMDITVAELLSALKRDRIFSETGPVKGRYTVNFKNKKLAPITYTVNKNGALTSASRFSASDKLLSTVTFQPLKTSARPQAEKKLLCKRS